jgi:hypothetical protein
MGGRWSMVPTDAEKKKGDGKQPPTPKNGKSAPSTGKPKVDDREAMELDDKEEPK